MRECATVVAVYNSLILSKTNSEHNGLYGQEESCYSFRQSFCFLGD